MKVPDNFNSWHAPLRGAYRKGYEAAMKGEHVCPYKDKRKEDGRLTWSRAFISAWRDGWDAARSADPINTFYRDRENSGYAALAK